MGQRIPHSRIICVESKSLSAIRWFQIFLSKSLLLSWLRHSRPWFYNFHRRAHLVSIFSRVCIILRHLSIGHQDYGILVLFCFSDSHYSPIYLASFTIFQSANLSAQKCSCNYYSHGGYFYTIPFFIFNLGICWKFFEKNLVFLLVCWY